MLELESAGGQCRLNAERGDAGNCGKISLGASDQREIHATSRVHVEGDEYLHVSRTDVMWTERSSRRARLLSIRGRRARENGPFVIYGRP